MTVNQKENAYPRSSNTRSPPIGGQTLQTPLSLPLYYILAQGLEKTLAQGLEKSPQMGKGARFLCGWCQGTQPLYHNSPPKSPRRRGQSN